MEEFESRFEAEAGGGAGEEDGFRVERDVSEVGRWIVFVVVESVETCHLSGFFKRCSHYWLFE